MSEDFQNQQRNNFRERFNQHVRTDSDEIQDWLNANGGMVFGAILIFIALYAIYALVF